MLSKILFTINLLVLILFAILHCASCATISSKKNSEQSLLVISYDAFRPEYFNRNVTPNINKFRREGTSAQFLYNVFPTKTFVNHHSIATVKQFFLFIFLFATLRIYFESL